MAGVEAAAQTPAAPGESTAVAAYQSSGACACRVSRSLHEANTWNKNLGSRIFGVHSIVQIQLNVLEKPAMMVTENLRANASHHVVHTYRPLKIYAYGLQPERNPAIDVDTDKSSYWMPTNRWPHKNWTVPADMLGKLTNLQYFA